MIFYLNNRNQLQQDRSSRTVALALVAHQLNQHLRLADASRPLVKIVLSYYVAFYASIRRHAPGPVRVGGRGVGGGRSASEAGAITGRNYICQRILPANC